MQGIENPEQGGTRETPEEKLTRAPLPEGARKSLRDLVRQDWTDNGVPTDFLNIWVANQGVVDEGEPSLYYLLTPAELCEAYVRKTRGSDPAIVEYILEKSRRETVDRLDELAKEFNGMLAMYKENPSDPKIQADALKKMSAIARAAIEIIRPQRKK